MEVTLLRVLRTVVRVSGKGEFEILVERLVRREEVWASILSARTAGEGGRGTERAYERARLGVRLVRAVLVLVSLCWGWGDQLGRAWRWGVLVVIVTLTRRRIGRCMYVWVPGAEKSLRCFKIFACFERLPARSLDLFFHAAGFTFDG